MHIAIDGTPAVNDIRAIQRYTWNLLRELSLVDRENNFSVLYLGYKSGVSAKPPEFQNPNFHEHFSTLPGGLLNISWKLASSPKVSFWTKSSPDLVHFPGGWAYVPTSGEKVITTLHGFMPLKCHSFVDSEKTELEYSKLRETIRRSSRLITVSETNKRELQEIFGVAPERITAIPLGVGEEFKEFDVSPETRASFLSKYKIPDRDLILYTGAIEPNKNIQGILSAFSKLSPAIREKFTLVLIGGRTAHTEKYISLACSLGILENIRFIDYINPFSGDLPVFYNLAKLTILPSFYEGWASPPLESMKCGTPALVSDIPSLKESTGDVACYCNPSDPDDIALNIMRLIDDNVFYEDMKSKGLEFAARHTWRKCAISTLDLYKSVMKS